MIELEIGVGKVRFGSIVAGGVGLGRFIFSLLSFCFVVGLLGVWGEGRVGRGGVG